MTSFPGCEMNEIFFCKLLKAQTRKSVSEVATPRLCLVSECCFKQLHAGGIGNVNITLPVT